MKFELFVDDIKWIDYKLAHTFRNNYNIYVRKEPGTIIEKIKDMENILLIRIGRDSDESAVLIFQSLNYDSSCSHDRLALGGFITYDSPSATPLHSRMLTSYSSPIAAN